MRGERLNAPDRREYERVKAEISELKALNSRLQDQNDQANSEIDRLKRILNDATWRDQEDAISMH